MMGIYYDRMSWVSGIAFFIAFVLTFWPTRTRMIVAAVLWSVGVLSLTGLSMYSGLLSGNIAYAFDPRQGYPLATWLYPTIMLLLEAFKAALLFPWVAQTHALRIGRILFLIVLPGWSLLLLALSWQHGFGSFPLGISWLGYPLLWFRIRENLPSTGLPNNALQRTGRGGNDPSKFDY